MAGARVVAWDSRSSLVGLNALTPLLYLPAWPVAVAAGLTRRWAQLATALVVVVAHVAFMAPELSAREALPAIAAGALRLRVDRKSTRLNSSHLKLSRMPSSA